MADLVELARQAAGGVATIPSEALRFMGALANPARFVRQVRGTTTPEDAIDTEDRIGQLSRGGVAQVLEGAGNAWNEGVNQRLGIHDPSPQDETASFVARIAGGSLPTLPIAGPLSAARAVIGAAPRAIATTANLSARALELLTPVTFTNATTTAGRLGARAANVGVQTAAGIGIDAALERDDPTEAREVYDMQGNLVQSVQPLTTPGVGRIVARNVAEVVGDHPVASGVGAAVLAGGALLGRRAYMRNQAIRDAAAQSDVIQPWDRGRVDEPVIPDGPRGWINELANTAQDANTLLKDAVEQRALATAQPDRIPVVRNAIDAVNEPTHKARLLHGMETGTLVTPKRIIQTEAPARIYEDLHFEGQRIPDLPTRTDDYIGMKDALDDRKYNWEHGRRVLLDLDTGLEARPGATRTLEVAARNSLPNLSDDVLQQRVRAIETSVDPVDVRVREYQGRYQRLMKDLGDYLVDWDVVGQKERLLWGNAHPNFMHQRNEADNKSPRARRDREHGVGPDQMESPLAAVEKYMDSVMAMVYNNRRTAESMELLQGSKWLGTRYDPSLMRATTVLDPTTKLIRPQVRTDIKLEGDVIGWYKAGELHQQEVKNRHLYNSLRTMPAHTTSIMGWMRQLVQSGMTGRLSLLVGQPFAIANAVMGAMMGYITRPVGRSFGLLDRGAQALTGGRIGIRADPTAIPGMLYSAGADIGAILSRAVGDAFKNSIKSNGLLSRIPGAEAVAERAGRNYAESVLAERHAGGSGNASTLGTSEYDSRNRVSVLSATNPHAQLDRVIGSPTDLKEAVRLYAARATPGSLKVFARTVSDINEAVGNMAQSYIYRTNRGGLKQLDASARMPEVEYSNRLAPAKPHLENAERLREAAAAAMAAGDPSLAKTHRAAARAEMALAQPHIDNAKPFLAAAHAARQEWFKELQSLNTVTRQLLGDTGQIGTALRDLGKPGQSTSSMLLGRLLDATPYGNIGMQASARLIRAMKENPAGTAASIAMLMGPMVVAPLWIAMKADDDDAAVGLPRTRIPYEISRPSWHQTRYVVVHIPGIPPEESPKLRVDPLVSMPFTLARELFMHVMNLRGRPGIDPTLAYSTQDLERIVNAQIKENLFTAAGNAQPFSQVPPLWSAGALMLGFEIPGFMQLASRGGAQPLPTRGMGGFDNSRLADDVTTKTFDAVAAAIGGTAAMTLVAAVRSGTQAEKREPGSFASAAFNTLVGKAQDRLPEVQPIWKQPERRASSDTLASLANAKEQAIQTIVQNRASVTAPGTIGGGSFRTPDPSGGGRAGVVDPEMRRLLSIVLEFQPTLQTLRDARTRARENMLSIEQRALPYADERRALNEQSRVINRLNGELLARYTRFEDVLSDRMGYEVRLESIDPSKPITQFRRTR
jgi:hypothetical protein